MKPTEEDKRRLRQAKQQLRNARCSCTGKHDPYWVKCERTMAEIAVDNALAIMGVVL